MGISSFGKKKAQQFNINDMIAKAREIAPKLPEKDPNVEDPDLVGPAPPQEELNPDVESIDSKKTKK